MNKDMHLYLHRFGTKTWSFDFLWISLPFLASQHLILICFSASGIDLGGQFKGTHVPQGTTMAIGQWYIDRRNAANTTERSPLLWSYQHAAPGIIATVGVGRTSNGEIDVVSQKYGKGKSFHLAKYSFDGKGNANAVFRNVVTFWK